MTNDRNVDDLAKLAARAWHRASWGISDPLLTVPKVAHSPGADPTQTLFRVAVVKLTAEAMAGGARQGKAALAVADELRRQQAPQMPDRRTIERWHREANTPGHRLAIFEAVAG
jgi:hypothetical protein